MEEQTIPELQGLMESGQKTAVSLTEQFLERIDQIDSGGPQLNAMLELNPEALAIARALDKERQDGAVRGALHGIPVVIKGNIDTGDQMETTAGSLALAGSRAAVDAFVVTKLRQAGAVILGKANLSEWANFRAKRSTSGWSSQGGQTRNPHALDRNPCGSSSGSGVAVAANLCAAAIGTETNGSIVCPANANGIVGLKPTVGLVSRSGIIPIAASQDTAGPMTRTVADAAVLLGAMTGVDPRDGATQAGGVRALDDYTPFLRAGRLTGVRIGAPRALWGFDSRVDALAEEALAAMRSLGAEVVDVGGLDQKKELDEQQKEVLLFEFKAGLNDYLARRGTDVPVHNLAEVIAFNEANRDRVMPFFGQEKLIDSQAKGRLSDPEYLSALEACRRLSRHEGIDATLSKENVQILVAPTAGPAWLTDPVNGDHSLGSSSGYAAIAGYPSISVPMGMIMGLPVNLSFFAGAWREPLLIRVAYAFEQATRLRRQPAFRPTIDLARVVGADAGL